VAIKPLNFLVPLLITRHVTLKATIVYNREKKNQLFFSKPNIIAIPPSKLIGF